MPKHPETNCDCGPKAASPLALRWCCAVCGTSAIMKYRHLPLSVTARELER